MMEFKRCTMEDALLLSQTRQKVWDATYRGIYSDEKIDNYDFDGLVARDRKRIEDSNNTYFLVMDGEVCAGYFYYGPEQNGRQYKNFDLCLNSLYFLPQYQGLGLGRRVFAHMCEVCRERGLDRFFCTCNIHNKKAQGFYEKMGGVVGFVDGGHENKADDQMYFEFYLGNEVQGMEVKVPLIYDKDAYKGMNRLCMSYGLLAFEVLLILYLILNRVFYIYHYGLMGGYAPYAIILMMIFLLVFQLFIAPSSAYKQELKMKRREMYITFTEDGFSTQGIAETFASASNYRYETLQRLIEGVDYMVLFTMAPGGRILLKKSCFREEDLAWLRGKLYGCLGKKYIIRNR